MDPVKPTLLDLHKRFEILYPATRIGKSLRAIVAEGNVNPDEIISLIRLEPLLTTRILREANYDQDKKIGGYLSLEEAATAIGFQRMYDLLGLFSYEPTESTLTYSTSQWKRAITSAVCMEKLADKHNLDRNRAYTIGLIHSVAEAVALSDGSEVKETNESCHSNNLVSQGNFAERCSEMLGEWGLPDAMVEPIHYQYTPLECQTTGKMACLLNLAKWITGVVREVDELPDQALGPDLLVLNLLGEGEQTLWNLVTDVSDSLHRADSIIQGHYTSC